MKLTLDKIEKATMYLPYEFTLNQLALAVLKVNNSLPTNNTINIQKTVERVCGIKSIHENNRSKDVAKARKIFGYIMRKEFGFSFPKIADIMNKDHATIIYYVSKVRDALNGYDNELKNDYEKVMQLIFKKASKYEEESISE